MCHYDQYNGRHQQPILVADEKLLGDQEGGAEVKQDQGLKAMMVFFKPMPK